MATRREREAAKARTPPASPLRAPSRASPLKSPPRSPGESLVSLVASTFEQESGDAGTAAAAETEVLRARVAMLESDVAARDARVETAESDVRRATRAVRELSARAERRNEERRLSRCRGDGRERRRRCGGAGRERRAASSHRPT